MFATLLQKATSYITETPTPSPFATKPSKAALFRAHFRLPDSQSPLQEILCELTLPNSEHYSGKLYLSESFICFAPSPPSASASAPAPAVVGFTLPLCAIRRVERLHSRSYMFALAITTWHGSGASATSGKEDRLTLQFVGMRSSCEAFCDRLKRGLRGQMGEVKNLKILVESCYSEYLLGDGKRKSQDGRDKEREPPDAGLGMTFKYPGDAKKLRDRSKMRLWAEYLRGTSNGIDGLPRLTEHRERPTRYHDSAANFPQAHPRWTAQCTCPLSPDTRADSSSDYEEKCGRLHPDLSTYAYSILPCTPTRSPSLKAVIRCLSTR